MPKFAIQCKACGRETFLRREPVYEDFRKVGETLHCASCGHEYASEAEVPYTSASRPKVFSDADRPTRPQLFAGDEKGKSCRHCRHYVTNPFVQRCGLHQMEVLATDCCPDFAAKGEDESEADPLAKLLRGESKGGGETG